MTEHRTVTRPLSDAEREWLSGYMAEVRPDWAQQWREQARRREELRADAAIIVLGASIGIWFGLFLVALHYGPELLAWVKAVAL
jgi:hypothetical protein